MNCNYAFLKCILVNVEVMYTVEGVAIGLAQFKCLSSMPQCLACRGLTKMLKIGRGSICGAFP